MEPQFIGYPIEVFYFAAIVGLALIFYRPRWAFYFIVFCLSVRNYHMAVFTRTPFLAEFLNLNDMLLWLAVIAMLRVVWNEQRVWAPKILMVILAILLIGSFQSLVQYGFDYDVIKALWGTWVFPIMMLISVNMVKDNQDAEFFYWALFLGALGAAIQHVFFIKSQMADSDGTFFFSELRTISFILSGGIFLVVSAFSLDIRNLVKRNWIILFWLMSIPLIVVSYILSFTRTVWVGAALSLVVLFVIFYKQQERLFKKLGYSVALIVLSVIIFQATNAYVASDINFVELVDQRTDFIKHEESFDDAYYSRESGMETEIELWQNSSMIWGVGASYPPHMLRSTIAQSGALNHVAFSSYLAHFGIIGLVTYGFLLPLLTIIVGRRYYLLHKFDYGGAIALTAMALALFDFFTLLSSNQYISPTGHVQGLIYGALWGLAQPMKGKYARRASHRLPVHQPRNKWLPGRAA